MDPNANLQEQLQLADLILDGLGTRANAERLAELVVALDEWIAKGGFLPSKWLR